MSKYKIVGQKEFDEFCSKVEEWYADKSETGISKPQLGRFLEFHDVEKPLMRFKNLYFENCRFDNCDFSFMGVESSYFVNVEFRNCCLSDSWFSPNKRGDITLFEGVFTDCDFVRSEFTDCSMEDVRFDHCDFTDATLLGCSIGPNAFAKCNLSVKRATPTTVNLIKAVNSLGYASMECVDEHWRSRK